VKPRKKDRFVKPSGCAGCSMETAGMGFCNDLIVPNSRFAVWARDPGTAEILAGNNTAGPASFVLTNWIIPRAGIEMPFSKANTLRCHAPSDKYPTGKIRQKAEKWCRQYDKFTPSDFDVIVLTLHPSSVMHSKFDPLPLIINDFVRVKHFLDQGLRVLVLMGGEAMELWAPWLKKPAQKGSKPRGITDWRGHFYPVKRGALDHLLPTVEFNSQEPHDMTAFDGASTCVDLEWNPERPDEITRVGLSVGEGPNETWSFPFYGERHAGLLNSVMERSDEIIMHNGLGHKSDVDVLQKIGVRTPLEKMRDTMLAFHLIWPQFAGMGHLDLWTFASMHTMEPNWKQCRGEGHCFGPCPIHQPAAYNAQDAKQDWRSWQAIKPELMLRGIL
jgi:hypothetical protein